MANDMQHQVVKEGSLEGVIHSLIPINQTFFGRVLATHCRTPFLSNYYCICVQ